ncbi:MAG: GNAT family N-acetyltransferase [Carbonactinosporaceae bacterium]
MSDLTVREAAPADYDTIITVMDRWWGRPVSTALPRLFLDHFHRTSLIVNHGQALAGFLVGFFSPDQEGEAYIHFVGVHPDRRGTGIGRLLYERFFTLSADHGVTVVRAITPTVNERSVEFHRSLGFDVTGPITDYHGPGQDRILFRKTLSD